MERSWRLLGGGSRSRRAHHAGPSIRQRAPDRSAPARFRLSPHPDTLQGARDSHHLGLSARRTPAKTSNHGKGRAIDLVVPGATDEEVGNVRARPRVLRRRRLSRERLRACRRARALFLPGSTAAAQASRKPDTRDPRRPRRRRAMQRRTRARRDAAIRTPSLIRYRRRRSGRNGARPAEESLNTTTTTRTSTPGDDPRAAPTETQRSHGLADVERLGA